jgi:hypothetical protein
MAGTDKSESFGRLAEKMGAERVRPFFVESLFTFEGTAEWAELMACHAGCGRPQTVQTIISAR